MRPIRAFNERMECLSVKPRVKLGLLLGLQPIALSLTLAAGCTTRSDESATHDHDLHDASDDTSQSLGDEASTNDNVTSSEEAEESTVTTEDPGESEGSDDDESHVPHFDLDPPPDLEIPTRCTKADFLFVVDNSASMSDEQANLIQSFPGFIAGIQAIADIHDYRILVVDSDAYDDHFPASCWKGECTCWGSEGCCIVACQDPAQTSCDKKPCSDYPAQLGCAHALGAGVTTDKDGLSCNFAGDRRYLLADQPMLSEAFACAATVGTRGNIQERMIDASLAALDETMIGPGQCNEGFLRDDAILVVTWLTDEDEKGDGSAGDPMSWRQDLLARKNNDEGALVAIGFIGDVGQPGAICKDANDVDGTGAEASPRLWSFLSSFGDHGLATSICADDFGPAFSQAVEQIGQACDEWIPK
jgi:hypothetical protein